MELNLVEEYLPTDVADEKVRTIYARLQAWYQITDPEIDTRPGSVFGDNFLLPAARLIAAQEDGIDLFTGDLDLQNVADGNIHSCEFVAKYLENFGVTDLVDVSSTGIIRLAMNADSGVTLSKSLQFQTGTQTFQLRSFGREPIRVLPVGSDKETSNDYVLTQSSPSRYYVDVPVEAFEASEVTDGSAFVISEEIDEITSAVAVGDFFSTSATDSLSSLARKTRTTFHAASMGTKAGLVHTLMREFPDLISVTPVTQGDETMTRSFTNQFGVAAPCTDVFIKSPFYGSTYKQVVKLTAEDGKFYAPVEFSATPLKVTKITPATQEAVELDYQVWCRSSDVAEPRDLFPKLSASFSDKVDYWLYVDPGTTEVGLTTDEDGNSYQFFEVTYYAEPLVDLVARWLALPENTPFGVSVNVRAAAPFTFNSFTLNYARDRGTKVNFSGIKDELVSYLGTISWPDVYTDAAVGDILFNYGIRRMDSVTCFGTLNYTPATHIVDSSDATTLTELQAALVEIDTASTSSSKNFTQSYTDISDPEDNLLYAYNGENTGFILELDQIVFNESS